MQAGKKQTVYKVDSTYLQKHFEHLTFSSIVTWYNRNSSIDKNQ